MFRRALAAIAAPVVLLAWVSAAFAGGSSLPPGVTQIIQGANITITPSGGKGAVTISSTGGTASAGGTSGQVQWSNGGALAGFTVGGDGTLNTSTGVLTITAANGKALSLGGAFTMSGAYGFTGTLTGTTAVTFPTSGTLLAATGNGSGLTGLTWAQIGSTPTTLSGYGITNGATTAANTFTGTQTMPASTTSAASINLPHGTAPTTPANGDCWTTTAGLYCRINGTTVGPFGTGGGGGISGPGATTTSYVPQWSNTAGTGLGAGLPVGTTGNSTIVQTTSGGTISPSVLPTFNSTTAGAVPASGGGTTNFLRADGTFAAPPTGSGTPVIFVGASTNSGNAYTISTTTPTGFTLTNQFVVRATISATNTGASTLAVGGTAAEPIQRQLSNGFVALVSGELAAGAEYDFTYNTTCTCYVVTNGVGSAVLGKTANYTVTAVDWAAGNYFNITAASVTITLPVSTSLAGNGGVILNAVGNAVTLAPNASDSINGGTVGASTTIPSGSQAMVTTDGAGHIYAGLTGGGLPSIATGTVLANLSGSTATPVATAVNALVNACSQSVSASTATVTPGNCTQSNIAVGASTTLTIGNGAADGQKLMLRLAIGGSYTVAFDTSVVFGTDVTSYTASASGKVDMVGLQWDATKTKWLFMAANHGF